MENMQKQLNTLLEDAFLEGNSTAILNLPYGTSNHWLVESVAQKIVDTLNLCLVSLDENELIVKNILKILTDFIPILKDDLEQTIVTAECMLRIATEETVPPKVLKCAVYNLNLLLEESGPVLNWLQKEELLEGLLLILGRKLPSVGDFECQSYIFETLCKIVYGNENKHEWIQSWFSDDEKTRSMFLNWNLEQFAVESRKILNQINRRELNPRTFAFAATAVYFGNVELKKLSGLEFWIDFNYDTTSITFFCKDFEPEDQDFSESWETVIIQSDDVESYSVQKKNYIKSIELCITLKCSCGDLVETPNPLFETNLVRMIFWIYVDISSHLKAIFGESKALAIDHTDTVAEKKVRKTSDSDVVKIYGKDGCDIKERRISDSAKLLCLSDDVNNFGTANSVGKNYDSTQKRKVSSSSLYLKESESERSFQINDSKKCADSEIMKSNSIEKYFKDEEKNFNDEDGKVTNNHYNMEHNSHVYRTRKSSDASFGFDFMNDNSDKLNIETHDGEEGRFKDISENLLKKKNVLHEKPLDGLQLVSETIIENKTHEVNKSEFHIFDKDEELLYNDLAEKPLQPKKTETNLSFIDSQKIKNSNGSMKMSQNDKKSTSSEGSHSSQKKIKKVDDPTKVSEPLSEEIYAISPTPSNRKKNRKTTMLTSNYLTDQTSSESQSYFKNYADVSGYERCISHKSVFVEDTDELKIFDSSQRKNTQNDTPNRQRKMRLYNINCDPVFDVPPSEQKKVNSTPTQKNSPFIDLSFKNPNKNFSLPLSGEDFCETKFLRKKSTDSVKTKKKHDIKKNLILETSDQRVNNSENNSLAKGRIKDLEVNSSDQETSENEHHHTDKDAVYSEPSKKRLKKNGDEVGERNSSTSKLLKRKPNDVEREIISEEAPPKKQRKAAIKAMEKNKSILEQKDVSQAYDDKTSINNHSNDEIENISTPRTKQVKKRKFKNVFATDTETGSSNVSWIGERHSRLFESPQKIYAKRKSRKVSKSTSLKKGTYKSTAVNSKIKRNSNLSLGAFEVKSKTGLSDLENYELVVETKTSHKRPSHLSRKPITFEKISKAINAVVETCTEKLNFKNPLDSEPNNANLELGIHDDIPEFYNDEELQQKEESTEKDLTNVRREDIETNIADESNTNQSKAKPTLKKKHRSSKKKICLENGSSSNSELHEKNISNYLVLSSSVKKRKLADLSASKEKAKRNKKDSNKTQSIKWDTVTNTEEGFHTQDLNTFDETSLNILSACKIQNPKCPKILEKGEYSSLKISDKRSKSHLHSTCLSPKIGILTEQSLSSLGNDEAASKVDHIEKFLQGLSDESNSPNNFQHSDNYGQAFTSVSNKASQSNKSSRSDNLLKHTTSENCLSEEIKISKLSSDKNYIVAKKNKCFTSFEESNNKLKASPERSLQKFSLMDIHEDYGLQEKFPERCIKEDNNEETLRLNSRKPSKQISILHVLGVEMDKMTHRLLKTLQKRFHDLNIKISASRKKVLASACAMISKENEWRHKDLKYMARASKVNRINTEKSLKKILLVGEEYFEAEKMHNHRMKRLHQKALQKYAARIKLAGTYAVKALEDHAAAKTDVLLKNVLKKIEYL